jgi:hypothetical protein
MPVFNQEHQRIKVTTLPLCQSDRRSSVYIHKQSMRGHLFTFKMEEDITVHMRMEEFITVYSTFRMARTVLRIRDLVLCYSLDTGSGSRMNFFWTSELGSGPCFLWNFLTLYSESLLCYLYETGLLLKLSPETVCSKKKLIFLLLPTFLLRT